MTNMTSGRPALRYGVVGDVLVTTARPCMDAAGIAVDRGREGHALVERVERDGVGADVAGVGAAKREEGALGVEGQLGVRREIAAPVVGQERLAPLARPLHGAAEAPRGPGDQRELGIAAVARAEIPADLARHHADRALRHAEGAGHAGPRPAEAPGARMDGVAAARRIPDADRRARLHRHAGDPLHPRIEPHHVGGARERGVHRRGIADLARRRTRSTWSRPRGSARRGGGGEARRHRGQRRPLHGDALGAVARGRRRLGDDHGDDLAHEARAVGGHRRVRRDEGHVRGSAPSPRGDCPASGCA